MRSKMESQLLENITATIPGAVFQFMARADGLWHFNFISKGVETLYEVTQEAACRDITVMDRSIIAEDRSSHRQAIEYAFQNKPPWSHEFRIRTSSGALKWVRSTSTPQRHPDDNAVWNGVLSDITEQKGVETALRESERRFMILSAATFEGIAITESGRFSEVNEQFAHLLGYDQAELIETEVTALIPPEHRERVIGNIRKGIESSIEHTMIRKDGTVIIVEAHGRNTTYRDRPMRITAVHDITETGGPADFARGANRSRGGKAFICTASTAKKGTVSCIVPTLAPGASITTSKNDVDYVVTEFGVVKLRGQTARQRGRGKVSLKGKFGACNDPDWAVRMGDLVR